MYENYTAIREKEFDFESISNQIEFYKSENERLKKLIEEKQLSSENYLLAKVLLDQQSPFLKSIIFENLLLNLGLKRSFFISQMICVSLALAEKETIKIKISNFII